MLGSRRHQPACDWPSIWPVASRTEQRHGGTKTRLPVASAKCPACGHRPRRSPSRGVKPQDGWGKLDYMEPLPGNRQWFHWRRTDPCPDTSWPLLQTASSSPATLLPRDPVWFREALALPQAPDQMAVRAQGTAPAPPRVMSRWCPCGVDVHVTHPYSSSTGHSTHVTGTVNSY